MKICNCEKFKKNYNNIRLGLPATSNTFESCPYCKSDLKDDDTSNSIETIQKDKNHI